ncbi:MAG TPA: hypothetical protein VMY76_00615 [Gemmatimonadales bacterium]|nr:hypothetical protein [Gemmatimonadales bacterium]
MTINRYLVTYFDPSLQRTSEVTTEAYTAADAITQVELRGIKGARVIDVRPVRQPNADAAPMSQKDA